MTDQFEVEFYCEACCDFCGDVIHVHFECPVCKNNYAGTNIYTSLHDHNYDSFCCEECGAVFKTVDGDVLTLGSVVKTV